MLGKGKIHRALPIYTFCRHSEVDRSGPGLDPVGTLGSKSKVWREPAVLVRSFGLDSDRTRLVTCLNSLIFLCGNRRFATNLPLSFFGYTLPDRFIAYVELFSTRYLWFKDFLFFFAEK